MLGIEHVNAIGNILNNTVVRGNSGHIGIDNSLQGNILTLKYSTIVYFASERSLHDQVRLLDDESMQRLSNVISTLKKQFKELTGEKLTCTEVSNKDNLELISATSNSPRKIAYYRRFIDLQVEV